MIGIGDVVDDTRGAMLAEFEGSATWIPPGTPNTLHTTAPAMAPGYNYDPRPVVRAGERVSSLPAAELAALQADQSRICESAALAAARGSPSRDGLARQCAALRAQNFARGVFVTQTNVPVDPHYRVQLTDAGEAVIASSAALAAARAALPGEQRRGFTMGVAVARGSSDAGYLAFLRAGLSPAYQAGLAAALRSSGTRGTSTDAETIAGLPRTAVIAGGAVVALGVIGALVYKMRR